MKALWIKTKVLIAKIGLVDRFLMLFMVILMLYTAIGLFRGATDSQNSNMVDVIVRTSAASIFGYFISGNFVKSSKTDSRTDSFNNNLNITAQENSLNMQLKNPIGFAKSDDADGTESGKISVTEYSSKAVPSDRLQIVIVSSVGICSLILLFIIKFFTSGISVSSAVVSQLRDFVSACIGFLVSCGQTE